MAVRGSKPTSTAFEAAVQQLKKQSNEINEQN
jgi:hypothetical protein